MKKWTEEELNFLINNYTNMKGVDIAKKIGRSASGIHHKASRLGLVRKGKDRQPRYYLVGGYLRCSEVNSNYFVHRRVMEEHLGRELTAHEIVHHKDGDKLNNNLYNLEIHNRSTHMLEHDAERVRDSYGRYI